MTSSNPFKLEKDNKTFFFDVVTKSALDVVPEYSRSENGNNRIKNITNELQDLAKKREEMFFKDSQINYIFNKEKSAIQLGQFITSIGNNNPKDKKFRVRALLKEKKQTIHQFLQKKKQIYLSKMNINIKKEQTLKLEDAIKDQQETLKARRLYFQNDVQFMHKFIEGIKKQAEESQIAVQSELKIQESLVSKLNAIQAQTQKIDNLISKDNETLNNLKTYKEFIDSFYDPQKNWKPYVRKNQQEPMFLTENMLLPEQKQRLTIKYQPENLLQIFNSAEENNIREIQILHDKEDEVQVINKTYNKELSEYISLKQEKENQMSTQQKSLDKKIQQHAKLKQRKKNSITKINVFDNENIDLDKVTNKVVQIFREISPKIAAENIENNGEKMMKKAMTEIEYQIQKLRTMIRREKQQHPHLINEVQKEIKENQKRQNLIRKKQEAKEIQLRKQRQQEKKRNEPPNQMIKGRRDMKKMIFQKKLVAKKETDVKVVDQSEKYFVAD